MQRSGRLPVLKHPKKSIPLLFGIFLIKIGFGRNNLYISDYNYTENLQDFEVTHDLYRGHIYSLQGNLMYQPHPNFGFSFSLLLFHSGAKGFYYVNGNKFKEQYNGNSVSCTLGIYFQFFNKQKEAKKIEPKNDEEVEESF